MDNRKLIEIVSSFTSDRESLVENVLYNFCSSKSFYEHQDSRLGFCNQRVETLLKDGKTDTIKALLSSGNMINDNDDLS